MDDEAGDGTRSVRVRPDVRRIAVLAAQFLSCGLIAAVVAAPVAFEQAVANVRFEDRVGTVPVEVSLTRNGMSTLDTGVLGRLFWEQTGAGGFGAYVRVTGTPQAGGTLASYASPRFVRANAAFVNDPESVAQAYGDKLRERLVRNFAVYELAVLVVGGLVLTILVRRRSWLPSHRASTTAAVGAVAVVAALGVTTGASAWLFSRWSGTEAPSESYPMPGIDGLSFSSPQTLEIAEQIRPFLQKNTSRTEERADAYRAAAAESFGAALAGRADDLKPRKGERIVIAEADPQGSIVGTAVRRDLYEQLREALGEDDLLVRTISGDVTSNGTVAEAGFVEDEAAASGDLPVAAVKGDHDTEDTLDQLADNDVLNPHLDATEVDGLQVVVANDPAFKSLFGGMVVNETGVSETEAGAQLREAVGDQDEALVVLLHQPATAAGYIGVDDLDQIETVDGPAVPRDDGIPDLPPGIINVGHLHDAAPPRVIWNTDTDEVTWTVVNQLGTSGGVEESPTFNRFSTPFSVPLKTLSLQLQYVDEATGLQTGSVSIELATDGTATITPRLDLGPS